MNSPLKPEQLDLMPGKGGQPKPITGTAAMCAASGLSPVETAEIERLISAPGPGNNGFDWHGDGECIVVKPVRGVAVYRNRHDDVVIRTQGDVDMGDGDDFAYVRPEALPPSSPRSKNCHERRRATFAVPDRRADRSSAAGALSAGTGLQGRRHVGGSRHQDRRDGRPAARRCA
jgi:hypothetical protein